MGMGRLVHQRERAVAARGNRRALLPSIDLELFNRQSLRFRRFGVAAEKTKRILARGEPIQRLAVIPAQGNVHLGEKARQEGFSQSGNMVEEPRADPLAPGLPRIEGDDLAAPLGLDHVPVGFEFVRVDQIPVVEEIRHIHAAEENENVAALGIHVGVLPVPLFGLIDHLRQHHRRLDRIESLGRIEQRVGSARTADLDIPEKLSRTALRHDARPGLGRGRAGGDELNIRKFPFKGFHRRFDVFSLIEENPELTFLLRRLDGSLPITFAPCVCGKNRAGGK